MTKKDFSNVNTDRLYNAIAEATAEPDTEPAETGGADPVTPAAPEDKKEIEAQEEQKEQDAQKKIFDSLVHIMRETQKEIRKQGEKAPERYEDLTPAELDAIMHDLRPTFKERKTYTKDEAEQLMLQMRTSGRKGLKLPRYNVAFAPDLYAYIQTMSRATGTNYTEYINKVVREHMNQHIEVYEQARAFLRSLYE